MDLKIKKIFYIAPVVLLVALVIFFGRPNSANAAPCANTSLGNGFTCVQSAVSANTNPFPTLAFSANNQPGNLLVAFIRSTGDKTVNSPAPTDTQGNVWQKAACVYRANVGYSICMYYAENSKAGANTVNANVPGNPDGVLILFEISGVKTSGSIDGTVVANGSSTSIDSGAITTTNATDLLLGGIMAFGSTPTVGVNWSPLDSLGQFDWLEYRSISATGSYNATASQNSSDWLAIEVAFKSSGTGSPPPTPTPSPPVPSPSPTPTPVGGSHLYISQNGAGSQDASNCSNAKPVGFFNSSSNWGNGVDKIGPGITVHLCGTFTGVANSTMLTTQGSGSAGNPITILFEPGAKLEAPYWSGTTGAIYIQNSYITIDGGSNGLIQNTLNGSAGAICPGGPCSQNQVSRGIASSVSADHAIAKNLTVANLFVRINNTNVIDGNGGADTTAIALSGNWSRVTQNTITMTVIGIALLNGYGGAHLEIDHNTMSACNHCIGGGTAGTNTNIDDINIHDNDFAGNAAMWDNNISEYHRNGIQIIADNSSCTNCTITNLQIYNNIFRGSWSTWQSGGPNQLNSPIFLDDQGSNRINGWKIFNNIFAMTPSDGGGVACAYGPCQSQNSGATQNLLVNNTFYQSSGGGTCIRLDNQTNLTMKNNIIAGCGYAFNSRYGGFLSTPSVDYNLWFNTYGSPGSGWLWNFSGCDTGVGCGFSAWQSAGFDIHGKNGSNPNLTAAFLPNSGSPAIGAGTNLTSLGITALNSGAPQTFGVGGACGTGCVARPSSAPWDIGAYQFTSGGAIPPPPPSATPLAGDLNSDHVINSLDFSLLNSKWLQSFSAYDLFIDGLINSFDFAIMSSNWGRVW